VVKAAANAAEAFRIAARDAQIGSRRSPRGFEIGRRQSRCHHRGGQGAQRLLAEGRGDDQTHDGLIVADPGSGPRLRPGRGRSHSTPQQVLHDVGSAVQTGGLIGDAHPHPQLQRHHGRGVVLLEKHAHPIAQRQHRAGLQPAGSHLLFTARGGLRRGRPALG
jgi:hypothetical protein